MILLYVALFFLYVAITYAIYKIIWYFVKMHAFWVMLRELRSKATFKRGFWGMIFSSKGAPLCEITTSDGVVEVSLLSFMSVHGRWNIEKTEKGYLVEARRKQTFFYKVYNHAEQPVHAVDYRRENRFRRCPLSLSPVDTRYTRQILVVYPRPIVALTLATTRLDELSAGDVIDGHEIMFAEEFVSAFIESPNA